MSLDTFSYTPLSLSTRFFVFVSLQRSILCALLSRSSRIRSSDSGKSRNHILSVLLLTPTAALI